MEGEKRRIRIRGIVLPVEWDSEGNAIKAAIFSANEEEYLIAQNRNSSRLLSLLKQEVNVRGRLREEAGQKVIVVEGYEMLKLQLPALITVVKEINEPRLPSLRGKMRSKKQDILRWSYQDLNIEEDDIGLKGSPTQVVKIFTPPPKQGARLLTGEARDVVQELVSQIKDLL